MTVEGLPPATDQEALVVVEDIVTLFRRMPERVLWSPGKAWWGLAIVRTDGQVGARKSHLVASIDGALTIAAVTWPSHYRRRVQHDVRRIARGLSDAFRLGRTAQGDTVVTCQFEGAICGRSCLFLDERELPWISPVQEVYVAEGADLLWTPPSDPVAAAMIPALHPWVTAGAVGDTDAEGWRFFAIIGEPVELAYLPPPVRRLHLMAWWLRHRRQESQRLQAIQRDEPAWMIDDQLVLRLVELWLAGQWSGEGPPPVAVPVPVQPVSAAPPAAEVPPPASPRPGFPGVGWSSKRRRSQGDGFLS